MDRFSILWNSLPKPVRVFVYLAVSDVLVQLGQDLGLVDNAWARYALILVNVSIVIVQSYTPEAIAKIKSLTR